MRRRTFLAGASAAGLAAGAGVLVEREIVPGRLPAARLLGRDGVPGSVPDVAAGEIRRGRFASAARGGVDTNWVVALPPGASPTTRSRLPVCVVLHGRGDDAEAMAGIGYPQFLAAAVSGGTPPFALASVDGADRYWHGRRAGDDTAAMVTREFLPLLAGAGLAARATDRIGLLGWSMGGYGSLLLAAGLGRRRVAVVAAESPALWRDAGDSAAGAFDDRADFERHDVFSRTEALAAVPVRIACGDADPFRRADEAFATALPSAATAFGPGEHTWGYWRADAPAALAFVGTHLTGDS